MKQGAKSSVGFLVMLFLWFITFSGEGKIMDAKFPRIKIDCERIFFDVSIIDPKTVSFGSQCPFPNMSIIFTDAIFERGSFVFIIASEREYESHGFKNILIGVAILSNGNGKIASNRYPLYRKFF